MISALPWHFILSEDYIKYLCFQRVWKGLLVMLAMLAMRYTVTRELPAIKLLRPTRA